MDILFFKYAKPHYAAFGSFSREMTLKLSLGAAEAMLEPSGVPPPS